MTVVYFKVAVEHTSIYVIRNPASRSAIYTGTISLCLKDIIDSIALLNNLGWLGDLLAQDMAFEEPRQPDLQLVREEGLGRD